MRDYGTSTLTDSLSVSIQLEDAMSFLDRQEF
jgi:hypothetical protein